ncbi:MAG: 4-amino-4-deoxychorismate lyase [Synechococcaceae cyanobacterium RL_1_2]|nr:4-amino-4-deoxychorismate lyase [Synechococcaceae cyanobacterium RL_1_2]
MANAQSFWYEGEFQLSGLMTIAPYDHGLLYGATVFTTLRVKQQNVFSPETGWLLHRDRLTHSVLNFGWCLPDWDRVEMGLSTMAKHFPVLRVTLFADGRELITGRKLPADLGYKQQFGITAIVLPPEQYQRSLPHHKTSNYLSSLQGKQYAQSLQADEAILTNSQGHWLETTTGNLWGWDGATFFTPPLTDSLLPGIKRQQLIEHYHGTYPITEESWNNQVIERLTAIAYINSVVELIPITKVMIVIRDRAKPMWQSTNSFPSI